MQSAWWLEWHAGVSKRSEGSRPQTLVVTEKSRRFVVRSKSAVAHLDCRQDGRPAIEASGVSLLFRQALFSSSGSHGG